MLCTGSCGCYLWYTAFPFWVLLGLCGVNLVMLVVCRRHNTCYHNWCVFCCTILHPSLLVRLCFFVLYWLLWLLDFSVVAPLPLLCYGWCSTLTPQIVAHTFIRFEWIGLPLAYPFCKMLIPFFPFLFREFMHIFHSSFICLPYVFSSGRPVICLFALLYL